MSYKVAQRKFDGGHAEDIRTFATDECEYSKNFDLFQNPHKLIPFADSVAEAVATNTMDDIQISDIDYALVSSSYLLMGVGNETNVSVKPTFWNKSTLVSASWSSYAVSAGNTFQKGSAFIYKDQMYALGYNGSNQYTLYRFNSAGSVTSIGTISSSSTFRARPFVHPQDNVAYIIIGTTITSWDGSTLTTTTTILPTGMEAMSLTDYGTYLHILMRPLRGNGNAIGYLWGRDATINTLQGIIDWGEGNAVICENINNILVAVMNPQNAIISTTSRFVIKEYSGGAVEVVKTMSISNTQLISAVKVKNGNKLYFGTPNDDCNYVFGKNKEGTYIVTQDRYYNNGALISASLGALIMLGDIMWRGFQPLSGTYTLMRSLVNSGESLAFTSTSKYRTTINPSMILEHRGLKKKLKSFKIYYTGKASGTVGVKYLVDGKNSSNTTTFESVLSESTTAIEDYKNATQLADNQAFAEGIEYQFQLESTGGVEIKGYEYEYDLVND